MLSDSSYVQVVDYTLSLSKKLILMRLPKVWGQWLTLAVLNAMLGEVLVLTISSRDKMDL